MEAFSGSIRTNAPHWGRGEDSVPCLTPERMVVERREERQTKALNKTNLTNTKHFAERGQRSCQGQVKSQNYRFRHYWLLSPTDAALISASHPERVQILFRRGAVLKTAKVRVKVRSGHQRSSVGRCRCDTCFMGHFTHRTQ